MQRGLEGRRIALIVPVERGTDRGLEQFVRTALERAGAVVDVREAGSNEEQLPAGAYAGLVAVAGEPGQPVTDARVVQLMREFLASEKPVAAARAALSWVIAAGGAAGRSLAADEGQKAAVEAAGGRRAGTPIHTDGSLVSASSEASEEEFASQVVRDFSRLLDERDVDAMSEQSFPASDPPATSPSSVGHMATERDADSKP